MGTVYDEINEGTRSKERNFGPLSSFFANKTVLTGNKYLLEFTDNSSTEKDALYGTIGYMPFIEYHHVKNVTLPSTYNWGSETLFMNNFATLADFQPSGDLVITLEEDQYGTVAKFINWCQRKIITRSGVMRPKVLQCISNVTVDISNLQDRVVARYVYNEIYFQSADAVTLSYDGADILQYSLTFKFSDWNYIPMVGPDSNIFNTTAPGGLDNPLKNMPNA